jgi:hypothetical protein
MNTLFNAWVTFKFNISKMVDNMLVEEPSNNGVDVFVIIKVYYNFMSSSVN